MNKDELKKHLLKEIDTIKESLPGLEESARPVQLEESIGRLTRMDAIGSQAVNKKTFDQAKKRLSKIKQTLEQIDNDDFGLCVQCEEPINFKRILAVPESKLCIECARKG